MKQISSIIILFLSLISVNLNAQCDEMVSEAEECASNAKKSHSYFMKAYRLLDDNKESGNIDDLKNALRTAQLYNKKAKDFAKEAESDASGATDFADDCGCSDGQTYGSDAETYAYNTYKYAEKTDTYIQNALAMDNADEINNQIEIILQYLKKSYNLIIETRDEADAAISECY